MIEPCQSVRAQDRGRQLVEGLEVRSMSFVAQLQPSKITKPTQRAFHDVSSFAEAAAVGILFANRTQERPNATRPDGRHQSGRAVTGVSLEDFRLIAWPTPRPSDGRHGGEDRQRGLVVAHVCRGGFHNQRQALRVGQQMAFATCFRPVCWIRPGVCPPKTARTLALSMTARSRLTAPAFPSWVSSSACSSDQTANVVHSENRRQQVLPLPQFISNGNACHGIPVLSTNRIPASARRLGTLGRPPSGDGFGSGGNSGSICAHNSSETSAAMRRPPCVTQRRDATELT